MAYQKGSSMSQTVTSFDHFFILKNFSRDDFNDWGVKKICRHKSQKWQWANRKMKLYGGGLQKINEKYSRASRISLDIWGRRHSEKIYGSSRFPERNNFYLEILLAREHGGEKISWGIKNWSLDFWNCLALSLFSLPIFLNFTHFYSRTYLWKTKSVREKKCDGVL